MARQRLGNNKTKHELKHSRHLFNICDHLDAWIACPNSPIAVEQSRPVDGHVHFMLLVRSY